MVLPTKTIWEIWSRFLKWVKVCDLINIKYEVFLLCPVFRVRVIIRLSYILTPAKHPLQLLHHKFHNLIIVCLVLRVCFHLWKTICYISDSSFWIVWLFVLLLFLGLNIAYIWSHLESISFNTLKDCNAMNFPGGVALWLYAGFTIDLCCILLVCAL